MTIRIECTLPALAGNWIDLSDVWTRGEIRRWYTGALANQDDVTGALLVQKLLRVHLYLADGTLIEDPATLFECIDDFDIRLWRWLSAGINDALREMMTLGEAKRRLLFDGVEMAAAKTPTSTPR